MDLEATYQHGGDTYESDTRPPASADSASGSAGAAGNSDARSPQVEIEREPAAADTDTLTKQTVRKMCEYIRESIADPDLRSAAGLAFDRFAPGRRDPFALAWAVFWWCKHRIRRVLDEGALMRLGEPEQVDMLISPAVLVKMRDAAEDCDGFTMMAAALLGVAAVEQCIVTVACDPRDRSRWSHVFNLVRLANGEWMPLDCSHGRAPGWMVPRSRLYRWQCWNLDGEPIDVAPPVRSELNGYVYTGRRPGYAYTRHGLGQTCTYDDEGNMDCSTSDSGSDTFLVDSTGLPVNPSDAQLSPITTTSGVSVNPQTGAVVTPSTSSNWGTALAALFSSAAKVATVAELPAGASLLPSGAVVGSGYNPLTAAGGGNIMLLVLLAVGAVFVLSELEGHK